MFEGSLVSQQRVYTTESIGEGGLPLHWRWSRILTISIFMCSLKKGSIPNPHSH